VIPNSKNAWEKFTLYGENDPRIRKVILESWDRCKSLGVSHSLDEVSIPVNENEFNKKKKENTQLLQIATPIMLDIYKKLRGGGYLLLLTDPNGYLIQLMADKKAQVVADKGGIVLGAKWTEENVGSTGLSIALKTQTPMATYGYEHFCSAFRVWDCSACPIIVNNTFFGLFDICRVGPGTDIKELYALVVAGAKAIEEKIAFEKLKEKEIILSQVLSNYRYIRKNTGIITYDLEGGILYKDRNADQFIRLFQKDDSRKSDLFNVLNSFRDSEENREITIGGKGYHLERKEIIHEYDKMGIIILINENPKFVNIPQLASKDLRNPLTEQFPTENPKLLKLLNTAEKIANSDSSILIQGESGSGKDVLTNAIHKFSKRKNGPFVAINCASLPKDLIASELFGYAPGAFTGANKQGNIGKLEAADGGTLFLDEIGDMPLDLQAMLLRSIEEKAVVRLGSNKLKKVDVRIIAATHKDLKKLIQKGLFREDLYYRLNVFQLTLPPLRERKEDIKYLLNRMSKEACINADRAEIQFTESAFELFSQYSWPGNLREMRNVTERIAYIHESDIFDENAVQEYIFIEKKEEIIEDEYENILHVLKQVNGNRTKAAEVLGISRSKLYRKLAHYENL